MRIAVVGPVSPYKGGIAHFNDSLISKLRGQGHEVLVLSWKRRYPAFLYPGKDQYDKDSGKLTGSEGFILDIFNPLTWLTVRKKIKKFEPNRVLFNWVTPFLAPVLFTMASGNMSGKRVLICHNVLPHERRFIDMPMARLVFGNMDYFIVHAEKEKDILLSIKSDASYKLGFHPRYNHFSSGRKLFNLRDRFDIGAETKVLLYFGYVRPYKGLGFLLDAIPGISSRRDIHLMVVGEIWEGKDEYLEKVDNLGIEKHVTFVDEYVPDEEVRNYFEQSDLVVLPYLSATQSGIAQIAFSFGTPVVITDVGGLKDLSYPDGTMMKIPPANSKAIENTVIHYFDTSTGEGGNMPVEKREVRNEWAEYASLITGKFDE